MSVVVILEANVKPESANEMMTMMKEALPGTRAFAGCQDITVHSNQNDQHNVVLVEHWDSKDHHEKYLAWRMETGFLPKMMSLMSGEPNMRYYDQVDV